jgi:hypothetical protein
MLTSVTEVVSEVVDPLSRRRRRPLLVAEPHCQRPTGDHGRPGYQRLAVGRRKASVFGPRSSRFARRLPAHGLEDLTVPGALVKPATLGDAAATGLTRAVPISAYAPPAPRSVMPAIGQNFFSRIGRGRGPRFLVGHGGGYPAGHRRTVDRVCGRGAPRIPPSQTGQGIAGNGDGPLRRLGGAGCCSLRLARS